ncbi:MAG: OB-fold domain-containing protein [Brevundimonas sp.]|uniref:Zn-ribbon domain-containing OB-fold protein n=1 Tax=uncultured Brevundimonas sp. TaxID=213418 RepID=UPI0025DD396F|nr:OB-fold domain-containing protein [uncultured Brevundimonas sp.]
MTDPAITAVVAEALALDQALPALLGSRCTDCATLYYPRVASCRNPACDGKHVVPTRVAGRGRLYSFTIQRYRPPALFPMEPWRPYALGLVDVEDGLRIMGVVAAPQENIQIGMPLRLSTLVMNDGAASAVVTHGFVVDDGAGA